MSTTYLLYTEVRFKDGLWECASPYIRNKKGEEILITTYESGSRSYFGNTYDKLRELNTGISFPEGLSAPLKKHFYDDMVQKQKEDDRRIKERIDYYNHVIVCVPFSAIKEALPSSSDHQYHGIFHKDDIYRYEMGEVDYLEPVTHTKYAKLTPEEKQAYAYYEYDDNMDWPYYFRLLKERVNVTVRQYIDATASWGDDPEVRIIAFAL